jgi:hypothetical protein
VIKFVAFSFDNAHCKIATHVALTITVITVRLVPTGYKWEIKCELRFDMIFKVMKADNSSVECLSADTKSCPVTCNFIAFSK